MPVAGVHGILNFKYFKQAGGVLSIAAGDISADWARWLAHGLGSLHAAIPAPAEVPVAYYADCLNRGIPMGVADPTMLEPFAQELFVAWVAELRQAAVHTEAVEPVPQGRATRLLVRQPAEWLTSNYGTATTRLVARLSAELAVYFDPAQQARRQKAQRRIIETVTAHRPRALLAHSLGSVVAYEAFCAQPSAEVEMFVTLGTPLGVPNVVFERLQPTPIGRGIRPPGARSWVNIADVGDPISLPAGRLTDRFDGVDHDYEESIHPLDPHAVRHYLGCRRLAEVLAPYMLA